MANMTLTAVGKERPGMVAPVTQVFSALEGLVQQVVDVLEVPLTQHPVASRFAYSVPDEGSPKNA